MVYVQVMMLN